MQGVSGENSMSNFNLFNFNSKEVIKDYQRDDLEAYKQLRTNIEFSSIDKDIQVLVVTSSDSAEAKSTTAYNLAKVMAAQKNRVLLIDCDLRIPDIHKNLKLSNRNGLTNALINNDLDATTLSKYVQTHKVPNGINDLFILTAGSTIPNPLEVLSSKRFKELISVLRLHFNFIVIDAPPVLPVADSIPISLNADGVLFCVASNQTHRERALAAITQLRRSKVNVIGTVLTMIESSSSSYYNYNYNYSNSTTTRKTLGHALKRKNHKLRKVQLEAKKYE